MNEASAMREEYKLDDVFGVLRDLPETYVERDAIDAKLIESLSRDRHIVIYGSSKQGKTCLRKHCLLDQDYITVSCQPNWSLETLLSAILKAAGFEVTQLTTRTAAGKLKLAAEFSAKAGIPVVGKGEAKGALEGEADYAKAKETAPIPIDPDDPNDTIMALKEIGFSQFIVLEDFHYLPFETQRDFSFTLKAFHENSRIAFIIVAVWKERNRLVLLNGDLTGRIIDIDADEWKEAELLNLIETGEKLLNIEFTDKFKADLIHLSFKSVYVVQEVCHRVCMANKIFSTQEKPVKIEEISAEPFVREVIDEQSARYRAFLTSFSEGFQKTGLEMYRWLLLPIITMPTKDLEKGIRLNTITKILKDHHSRKDELNVGNITQALQYAGNLQAKKSIKPFVLDYDQNNLMLNIVDRSFIIWRESQNANELCELVQLPSDAVSS